MLDAPVANHQRQPLDQAHALHFEHRQAQRVARLEFGVAQDFKRQMQSRNRLLLVFGGLRAESKCLDAELAELGHQIAETAALRRAASRTGNHVPPVRERLSGNAGSRIAIDHSAGRDECREIDHSASRRTQQNFGHGHALQMSCGAVVNGTRQIRRQGKIVWRGHSSQFSDPENVSLCVPPSERANRPVVASNLEGQARFLANQALKTLTSSGHC